MQITEITKEDQKPVAQCGCKIKMVLLRGNTDRTEAR